MSEALYKFLILIVVMATRIHARMNEEKDDIQEQLKILQNTMKELQDTVYVQTIRSDQLEEKLVESEKNVQEMKELLGDEVKKLDVRISRLESAEGHDDHTAAITKPGRENNEREINQLKSRLGRLEKKQDLMMDNLQALRSPSEANYNRETEESEKGGNRSATQKENVNEINRRLLSPPSPTSSSSGVAFYAYMSSILASPSMQHVLVFDVVKTNIGNAYHPTTGVFMVPESGVYVFTWTFRTGNNHDLSIELVINRESFGVIYLHTLVGAEVEETGMVVAHVNAGDDVFVRTHSTLAVGNNYYIQSNQHGRSSFAGWKI